MIVESAYCAVHKLNIIGRGDGSTLLSSAVWRPGCRAVIKVNAKWGSLGLAHMHNPVIDFHSLANRTFFKTLVQLHYYYDLFNFPRYYVLIESLRLLAADKAWFNWICKSQSRKVHLFYFSVTNCSPSLSLLSLACLLCTKQIFASARFNLSHLILGWKCITERGGGTFWSFLLLFKVSNFLKSLAFKILRD